MPRVMTSTGATGINRASMTTESTPASQFGDSRINCVTAYIMANLDEALAMDRLAALSGLSCFHFHRLFRQVTGMTVGLFIRLARLKRASLQLVFNRQRQITDIALEAGFECPESFTRAFRRVYGQAPSLSRHQPDWERWWPVHHP
ncbi:MAG: helix-turn-helix domain-containing protein [Pseudohongiellaceae bacterium]